ncbi:hypothetical protein [uncultured Treponema sp.]|uniref:hypothetical protein n=1 Tax=uncultured Treponema sp. TaxID=162155 RepID=UPI0025D9C175|nr:hypothetical protein [uncultured Treponema sp.]
MKKLFLSLALSCALCGFVFAERVKITGGGQTFYAQIERTELSASCPAASVRCGKSVVCYAGYRSSCDVLRRSQNQKVQGGFWEVEKTTRATPKTAFP